MSDDENENKSGKTDEDMEYEYDLMMETAERLSDLAMGLCHYDDEIAKRALAVALGTLSAHYDEPCIHQLMDLAEAQMEAVLDHIETHHSHDHTHEHTHSHHGSGLGSGSGSNKDSGNN